MDRSKTATVIVSSASLFPRSRPKLCLSSQAVWSLSGPKVLLQSEGTIDKRGDLPLSFLNHQNRTRQKEHNKVQAVINHLAEGDPKYAQYKPADFIEAGPLAELDKSGFIDRLYGDNKNR